MLRQGNSNICCYLPTGMGGIYFGAFIFRIWLFQNIWYFLSLASIPLPLWVYWGPGRYFYIHFVLLNPYPYLHFPLLQNFIIIGLYYLGSSYLLPNQLLDLLLVLRCRHAITVLAVRISGVSFSFPWLFKFGYISP